MPEFLVHGGAPPGFLEFSANLHPRGVPARVRRAVARASYATYAALDPEAAAACLARDAGVDACEVLVTAGASEALRLATTGLLTPSDRVVVVGPTYGEYARLAGIAGAAVEEVRAAPPEFAPPIGCLLEVLRRHAPRLVFLCDPNNPTGQQLTAEELAAIIEALPPHAVLVLDQSFLPFGGPTLSPRALIARENVLLVRSLTKVLAAPGLRLGYVIGPAKLLAALGAVRDPWPVGAHALATARAASFTLPARERAELERWRERLAAGLRACHLHPVQSGANFLLVYVGEKAPELCAALAARRIAIRPCASFGLPEHVRVAVRPPREQDVLLRAVRDLRAGVGW